MNPNVHTADDGRGLRNVFVNGKKVDAVFYANTETGVVRAYKKPYTIVGDEIESYEVRGTVKVVLA